MFMIYFYVPVTHLEMVKEAVFATGAGNIDNYSHCAWQTLGEGQFKPLAASHAYIGEINRIEKVAEYKVEIICSEKQISAAVAALKNSHPYETPAYQVIRIENF